MACSIGDVRLPFSATHARALCTQHLSPQVVLTLAEHEQVWKGTQAETDYPWARSIEVSVLFASGQRGLCKLINKREGIDEEYLGLGRQLDSVKLHQLSTISHVANIVGRECVGVQKHRGAEKREYCKLSSVFRRVKHRDLHVPSIKPTIPLTASRRARQMLRSVGREASYWAILRAGSRDIEAAIIPVFLSAAPARCFVDNG